MASQAQIDANRLNAQRSTGPRTEQGKAVSRMNAVKHGLRARSMLLPGENAAEFHQICDGLEAEWQPQTPTEFFLVEQMAVTEWRIGRLFGPRTASVDPVRLEQMQTRLERSYLQAVRLLRSMRAEARRRIQREAKLLKPNAHESAAPPVPPDPPVAEAVAVATASHATPAHFAATPKAARQRPVHENLALRL